MRILFLTNFYPPHELGGQGQSCQQVVEGLRRRGHETAVLTSMHGVNNISVETDGIYRSLYLEMDLVPWRQSITFFTSRKKREKQSFRTLERVIQQFQPDALFIWGMWNMPRSLSAHAEALFPGKVLYRFADYWPTLPSQHEFYWQAKGQSRMARLPKKWLGAIALSLLAREEPLPPLKFEHTICVSAAVRNILVEAGIPVADARIIHTGLDVTLYQNGKQERDENKRQTLDLIYAGRLSEDKGVETAVAATAILINDHDFSHVRLKLAGSGSAEYEEKLTQRVVQKGISDFVIFLGRVPGAEMPALLLGQDILLLPSIWAEPFARTVLEGMASGLVVVAAPTGGTGEIVKDRENGMLFVPGDAHDLAQKITELAADGNLRQRLADAGYQTVVERFTVVGMMDKFERFLEEIVAAKKTEGGRV